MGRRVKQVRKIRTLPKYVYRHTDRHGKIRYQAKRKINRIWQSVYLPGLPASDEFNAAYEAFLNQEKPPEIKVGEAKTIPGTMNAAIVAFLQSSTYQDLRETSKKSKRLIIEKIRVAYGDKRLVTLAPKHVQAIINNMSDKPQAANRYLSVLRQILDHSILLGFIQRNPTIGVKGYSKKTSGIHTWDEHEVHLFEETFPIGTKQRLAFDLMLYTGQRRGDITTMGWQHISNGLLNVTQSKTGVELQIPLHENLLASLNAQPRTNLTFLVTQHGKPFSKAGIGNWFRKACDKARLKHCSAHGLRKAISRRLAEAGATPSQIQAITGHKTLSEVARYTAATEQVRLANQALNLISDTNVEQKVSQPTYQVGKNKGNK